MGGSFLAGQGGLVAAFGAVGVDDLDQVAGGAGQLGGVEPARLLEQHLFAALAQGGAGRAGCRRRRR